MRRLLMLLFPVIALVANAQTFSEGYYQLQVVRQNSTLYCDNGVVCQNTGYTIPTAYTLADLPYIFKFTASGSGFTIQNCKSLEYIVMPSSASQTSVILTTSLTDTPAVFNALTDADGKFYGFSTTARKEIYSGFTSNITAYLNDLRGANLCLWEDGPNEDNGSCFMIMRVDEDIVEPLMSGTSPDKTDIVGFTPETNATYTIYSHYVNGYACGDGVVSGTVVEDCEYAFERAGVTSDNLTTYYIKQVSSGKYLQHVVLDEEEDSSDTGMWTPYGPLSGAGRFTVLKAIKSGDGRAKTDNIVDDDYVICDTETYTYEGKTIYTYWGGYSDRMFFSPWTDSNNLRIDKYVVKEIVKPDEELADDQSEELFGAATDTITVRMEDGSRLLIPDNMIDRFGGLDPANNLYGIHLKGDSTIWYVERVAKPEIGADYPRFRTFKFNNKYNDALFTDVNGTVYPDSVVLNVACIGKTMCPSFSLTSDEASVYYKGVRQTSHRNRHRFDKILTYTVANPGQHIMQICKVSDEVWSTPTVAGGETEIPLTVSMLSTNAPSNSNEGLDKLVDGDVDTYYHSTWGSGQYDKLNYDASNPANTVWPYVDIHLNEPVRVFKWSYTTQSYGQERLPGTLSILASDDGDVWTEVAALRDGLPTGMAETYTTDAIDMGAEHTYLRILLTSAAYKNYLCIAEMSLTKIETTTSGGDEPVLVKPAVYQYTHRPYGRDVKIRANFLTDHATDVPRVDITLDNGVSYSEINKTSYLTARITIDGGGVFPNMLSTPVNIRGRGNSSWSYSKKPYRLKFNEKQKPFGLTKGKSWCLIAQAQTGSMLTNPIALRVATMTGSVAANHVVPVNLYINGTYRGSYMFTENPGFSNNSVNIDETDAYMLEIDSYFDEEYRFNDDYYGLPINIKEPDLSELNDYAAASAKFNAIKEQFNAYTEAVHNGDTDTYERMMDVDSWSRFMLVNDLARNTEMKHPKSIKLFRERMSEEDLYVWGPCWDFDWAFGYEETSNYYIAKAETDIFASTSTTHPFFQDLQQQSDLLNYERYRVWTEFMTTYRDELLEYIDDYVAYANPSFLNNATVWNDGRNYALSASNAKSWLTARTNWVYNNMTAYDLPAITYGPGDVNEDGQVTVSDVVCVINKILGKPVDVFNMTNADMNGDGVLTIGDVQLVIRAVLDAGAMTVSARSRIPHAAATLTVEPFTTTSGSASEVTVNLVTEETVAGMQMDVVLPIGATLTNVRTRDALSPFRTRVSDMGGGRYRVVVLAQDGSQIEIGDRNNMVLDVVMGDLPKSKADRMVRVNDITLSSPEGADLVVSNASGLFAEATSIATISSDEMVVRGGEDLRIECVKDGMIDVCTLSGAVVRRVAVHRGTTTVNLHMGIYIVGGQKIIID